MTESWDFYLCRFGDKPASIFVDLGLAGEAPIAAFPCMASVRVHMRAPRPDGLSSQEEFETLASMEDSLTAALTSRGAAVHAGRITCNGCRDFFFYVADSSGCSNRVARVMQSFAGYRFETRFCDEPSWQTYFELLYPSEIDHQRMANRRVCRQLEQNGDGLAQDRDIDHWAYFPDAASRSAFIDGARKLGFTMRSATDPEKPGDEFGAHLVRADVPGYGNIDAVTEPLFNLARQFGGRYDGWGCPIVS